ncbi:MAG: ABC transporter permease [Bacteroidales bacterium]|nr:ABC transporter permease [Bacteroidales bacterium]
MLRLIKIDFKKYAYNRTFWILLLTYFILIVSVFFFAEKFLNLFVADAKTNVPLPVPDFSFYSFPYVWHNLAFFGGFFKILTGLIVVIFVTNEYSYKTIRQNVMNGMGRGEFLLSKVIFAGLLSISAALVLVISGLILGLVNTPELRFSLIFTNIGFIAAYFLELFSFSLLAMLIGFLLRQSGLSIVMLAIYFYIAEPILVRLLPDKVSSFLPVESMANLIDFPNSELMKMFNVNFNEFVSLPDVFICSFWSVFFVGMAYLLLRNRDF